jgi:hypothetical protein
MWQFIISLLLVAALALIQLTNWFSVANLKPNLILALLASLTLFEPNWLKRSIFIFTAVFLLKFSPTLNWLDLILLLSLYLVMVLIDNLPWLKPVNLLVALVAGTILLNLDNFRPALVFPELIGNIFLSFLFFSLLKLIYGEKTRS